MPRKKDYDPRNDPGAEIVYQKMRGHKYPWFFAHTKWHLQSQEVITDGFVALSGNKMRYGRVRFFISYCERISRRPSEWHLWGIPEGKKCEKCFQIYKEMVAAEKKRKAAKRPKKPDKALENDPDAWYNIE